MLEEAAALTGLDVKRLRGRIFRNSVHHDDPIGDATHVYRWSLRSCTANRADDVRSNNG